MKKRAAFLILFTCFLAGPLAAQWKLAPKAGVVLSTLRRDASLNLNGGAVGYLVGFMAKMNMGELGWFTQAELQYAYFGDRDQKFSFVKIPLILGFDVSDDVNIHGGYQPGFLVGGNNNAKENFKSVNHEISLGMDFLAGSKVLLGLRVNYGLTNLVEKPAEVKNLEVKSFTADFYIGFLIYDSN